MRLNTEARARLWAGVSRGILPFPERLRWEEERSVSSVSAGRRLRSGRCTWGGVSGPVHPPRRSPDRSLVMHVTSEREEGTMSRSVGRGWAGRLVAVISIAAVSVVTDGTRASAVPAPLLPPTPDMPSADALPTVQIDGVVWSQAVVGNTVYAGGSFKNARPAGAAPGTNLTPRGNLLAFDIRTGDLITSFAPSLNGQVLAVAASPDGSRIYVAGDFTTANGQARQRVAAYSTTTGR